MREIIARDKPFTKEVWTRDKAKKTFRDMGEAFKVELDRRHPRRPAD
jgi:threonyl-tRNA synthetase